MRDEQMPGKNRMPRKKLTLIDLLAEVARPRRPKIFDLLARASKVRGRRN